MSGESVYTDMRDPYSGSLTRAHYDKTSVPTQGGLNFYYLLFSCLSQYLDLVVKIPYGLDSYLETFFSPKEPVYEDREGDPFRVSCTLLFLRPFSTPFL